MGMTEQSFRNAIEARELVSELRRQLGRLPYNPDLLLYCDNLGKMISELSSIEVEARRTRRTDKYDACAERLKKSVAYLQHLILMHQIMS
jgi:hypothetical protein